MADQGKSRDKSSGKPSGKSVAERTRRAFIRRQWARRWLTWRYLVAGGVALLLVGLGFYALFFSSWLRAEKVEVRGTNLVSSEEVLAKAEVPLGDPLVRVDLEAIEVRVLRIAGLKEVDVSRSWPHGVRIEVTERTPIAVLMSQGKRLAIDADGKRFATPAKALKGLPLLRVGAGADTFALQEGAAVIASLDAEVREQLDYVELRTIDQINLHLRDGRLVRWGSAEESDTKAEVLLELLGRKARIYDVSVPGAPTTQ